MELKEIQERLKEYFKLLDEICGAHDIQYWADGGTLLGTVRNQGIIPYDDDGDICMYETELEKLKNKVERDYPQYMIYGIEGVLPKFMKRDCPYAWIDIFLVEDHQDLVHYKHKRARSYYPGFYHFKRDLFPLQRVAFEDIHIWIPNNPIPYLERGYNDWKTPVQSNVVHKPIWKK